MRTIKILMGFAIAALIFTSCNDDNAEPNISWDGALSKIIDFGVESEYNVDLAIAVNAEAGIKTFEITQITYTGEDYTSFIISGPEGFSGLIDYTYNFTQTLSETDFANGVDKIEFEFAVTDDDDVSSTKSFIAYLYADHTITFDVKDASDNVIDDAIVTFGDSTYAAGTYVINYVDPATYSYSVAKEGYQTVSVTDFEVSEDATVSVVLNKDMSDWIGDVILTLESQSTWATYNTVGVTEFESAEIGVICSGTDVAIATITKTDACEGWVVIDDISTILSYNNLATTYSAGTPVTTLDLDVEHYSKTFAEKYFISKIGDDYVLVHYKNGLRNSQDDPDHSAEAQGCIVVFEYKTKA
jgi:hypothetical protein